MISSSFRRNFDIISRLLLCVKTFLILIFFCFMNHCPPSSSGLLLYHFAFLLVKSFFIFNKYMQQKFIRLNSFLVQTEKEGFEPSRRVNDLHP